MAKSNNPTYANKKVRVSDQKFAEDYYKDGKRKGQELGKPKRKWILKACNHIQDLPGVVVGYGDPEYKALECVMTDEEAKIILKMKLLKDYTLDDLSKLTKIEKTKLDKITRRMAEIAALTRADVIEAIKQIIDFSRAAVAAVGNLDEGLSL